ncbi:CotH kinase family protein [Lachnospiraceae bacterium ZAX-1]
MKKIEIKTRKVRKAWMLVVACFLMVVPLSVGIFVYGNFNTELESGDDAQMEPSGASQGIAQENVAIPIITMYLTVYSGNENEGAHSWRELNDGNVDTEERFGVEGILQVGNEDGPLSGELGDGILVPNAMVTLCGDNALLEVQKSYKIELKKNAGDFDGQTEILLNKNINDGLRFRNSLARELISQTGHMVACKTQFVHLYVKDESEDDEKEEFYDYGLFTQVEQINEDFLANHGFAQEGSLYKAVNFDFRRHEEELTLESSADNTAKFNTVLEAKLNSDYDKLIQMLTDVNHPDKDIKEIMEQYFDEDNYYNWLAFQILTGNKAAIYKGFYLYSPNESSKFYFIAGDTDGILKSYEEELTSSDDTLQKSYEKELTNPDDLLQKSYEEELTNPDAPLQKDASKNLEGLSLFFDSVLHRRVLLDERCREKLDVAIEGMYQMLSGNLLKFTGKYRDIVKEYVFHEPDVIYEYLSELEYDEVTQALHKEMDRSYEDYKNTLKRPIPFKPIAVFSQGQSTVFEWEASKMVDGFDVRYTVELAVDYSFQNMIYSQKDLHETSADTDVKLSPGQYFVRVTAKGDNGEERKMNCYYEDYYGVRNSGVLCFYVLRDGSIQIR